MPTSDDLADRTTYPLASRDANLPATPGHAAIRLHVVEAGPADGPLVVLLHGFPEFWYSWRRQIGPLADAGYRVIAPDLRGYGDSDKPDGVASFEMSHLVADVVRLIRWAGREKAHVVGHDWGAVVAWMVANDHPEVVERLAILNVPHPRVMWQGLTTVPGQMLRSWYILFFQLPWLPEAILRRRHGAAIRMMLRREPTRKDAFTAEDIEKYVEAMLKPGAARSTVSYYRAALRGARGTRTRLRRIGMPVQVIWGEKDRHLGAWMADPPRDLVPDQRVLRLPDASHWVQNDAWEVVNETLIGFLR